MYVPTIPNHRAYTLGISQANLKVGAGMFMGHHPTHPNLKAFGKAIAQANILCGSWTILHVEVLLQKTDSQLRAKRYFELLRNILVDWSGTNCANLPHQDIVCLVYCVAFTSMVEVYLTQHASSCTGSN